MCVWVAVQRGRCGDRWRDLNADVTDLALAWQAWQISEICQAFRIALCLMFHQFNHFLLKPRFLNRFSVFRQRHLHFDGGEVDELGIFQDQQGSNEQKIA
jgi:hypothetical protein